jgi:hypothetical protein
VRVLCHAKHGWHNSKACGPGDWSSKGIIFLDNYLIIFVHLLRIIKITNHICFHFLQSLRSFTPLPSEDLQQVKIWLIEFLKSIFWDCAILWYFWIYVLHTFWWCDVYICVVIIYAIFFWYLRMCSYICVKYLSNRIDWCMIWLIVCVWIQWMKLCTASMWASHRKQNK